MPTTPDKYADGEEFDSWLTGKASQPAGVEPGAPEEGMRARACPTICGGVRFVARPGAWESSLLAVLSMNFRPPRALAHV